LVRPGAWIPAVSARAGTMAFACVRRCIAREEQLVRRRQGNSRKQEEDTRPFQTADIVPAGADVASVYAAANLLDLPWLSVVCAARMHAQRPDDLAYLHALLAGGEEGSSDAAAPGSCVKDLSVAELLELQERLLHRPPLPAAATASPDESPVLLRAVLNMAWFQRVASAFPATAYKAHLKRRAALLQATVTAGADDEEEDPFAWLEPSPAPASPSSPVASAPSILWCRIFVELHCAAQVTNARALERGTDALWRQAGPLLHCLHVDVSDAASTADRALVAQRLQALCKDCTSLRALSLRRAGGDEAMGPQLLLRLLASLPALQRLHLQDARAPLDAAAVQQMRLAQYFPDLRVTFA